MNRFEFIVITAIILFAAFALGWFAHWLLHRFTRVTQADLGELERMAQSLHEAEDIRDQAVAWAHERDEELTRALKQTQAELAAAMDGLREARYEAEMLRRQIESHGSA